ncbi:MAG: hybrid sensor histidine kinase/response regulator [Candidatus Eiseniibacteriota bacterium]
MSPPASTNEPGSIIAREKRQRKRLAALLDVSRVVTSSLDPKVILETIADKMSDLVGATEVTIFGLDEDTQILSPLVARVEERYYDDVMRVRLRVGEGITGSVVQTGVGEIVGYAERDPRAVLVEGTPEDEATSLVCVPFFVHDRVAGVIALSRYGVDQFTPEDLEIVTIFAGHCSVAIANAGLYEDLRRAFEELRATQSQLVQSAKLNALGEMASGVAHDFNNLLAAILGRTQLLLAKVEDPGLRRSLELIEQTAQDGAQTVRRIQEFTRVRMDEVFDEVDLNRILLDVLELTRPSWQTQSKVRGAVIEVSKSLTATGMVAGNASELREVFTNLVLNAADAMPAGGTLTLHTRDDNGHVVVEVSDTGHGMDPETQARCFDPFFTTKAVKGTGLGLSVAYGIVGRHHGRIAVESTSGEGTRFRLAFPIRQSDETRAPQATPPGQTGSFRVLVVDDEESVLSVLSELLEALGQRVTAAHGGHEGLNALRESKDPPEIVFTDLGMPGVNGWDVARETHARAPGAIVVLVTGWGVQIDAETARSRGVEFLLGKPFTVDEVENTLMRIRARFDARASISPSGPAPGNDPDADPANAAHAA